MNVINWPLLKHPMNWITVVLMILIAGAAFHFVLKSFRTSTATAQQSN